MAFLPLGSKSGHGVGIHNLAGESSNPEVNLTSDLIGVVLTLGASVVSVDVVVVLLLPDGGSGGGLGQVDISLLDGFALGVGNIDTVSKVSKNPGEKLARLHGNVVKVVKLSAFVIKGIVGEPNEPVTALNPEESVGNVGPGHNFASALCPFEVIDVVTIHTFDVVFFNGGGVPVVNLVSKVEKYG